MAARFTTALEIRKIGYDTAGRPIYKVLSPLQYESPRFGTIVVPAGFNTNFCSVPRLPVAYWLAGDRAHEQGTLHDYLYTVRLPEFPRLRSDEVFLEALGADTVIPCHLDRKVEPWLASLMYRAVRLGGESSWRAPSLVPQPQHVDDAVYAVEPFAP